MAVIDRKKSETKKQIKTRLKVKPKVKVVSLVVKASVIADLRKRLQLKQAVFARLLPVSVRSLATLESGAIPTEGVARKVNELKRLANALSDVIKNESLGMWLQTPNDAFDGLKPLEVIDRGEIDRLWSMIFFLRSGVTS